MTREEFAEGMRDFSDLMQFCYNNDLSTMDDMWDEDTFNDFVSEEITNYLRSNVLTVEDIQSYVNGFPSGYSYYVWNGYECEGLSEYDDFDEWYGRVFEDAEICGVFDEPEDDYNPGCSSAKSIDEIIEARKDNYVVEEEEFPLSELLACAI